MSLPVQDSSVLGVTSDTWGVREPIQYFSSHMLASTHVMGLSSTDVPSMVAVPRTDFACPEHPKRGTHKQATTKTARDATVGAAAKKSAVDAGARPLTLPDDASLMEGSMLHNVSEDMGLPADLTVGSYGSLTAAYALPSTVSSCATAGVPGVHVAPGHQDESVTHNSTMTAPSSTVTGIFGHNTVFGNDTLPENEETCSDSGDVCTGHSRPDVEAMRTAHTERWHRRTAELLNFSKHDKPANVPSYLIEDAGLGELPWENGNHEDTELPITKACVSRMLMDGAHTEPVSHSEWCCTKQWCWKRNARGLCDESLWVTVMRAR